MFHYFFSPNFYAKHYSLNYLFVFCTYSFKLEEKNLDPFYFPMWAFSGFFTRISLYLFFFSLLSFTQFKSWTHLIFIFVLFSLQISRVTNLGFDWSNRQVTIEVGTRVFFIFFYLFFIFMICGGSLWLMLWLSFWILGCEFFF